MGAAGGVYPLWVPFSGSFLLPYTIYNALIQEKEQGDVPKYKFEYICCFISVHFLGIP